MFTWSKDELYSNKKTSILSIHCQVKSNADKMLVSKEPEF